MKVGKKIGFRGTAMALFVTALLIAQMLLSGCGDSGDQSAALTGSCEEILAQVYEKAEFDDEMREGMEDYQTTQIDSESAEYILGTDSVQYTDAVCSMPMINVIPYQCVLLRVSDGQDVEAAKQAISDNADPRKWVCVEAESVVVENVGDVILFIMADQASASAVKEAFLSLGEV